jgi:diaminohydroxyphosphoribosylaminopyrimidine deaminase / 5-amino-6-(5-phosphoribosylamino)uracil reductase
VASVHELSAMRRAIAISAQGLGSTSPNPPVGCVILDSQGRTVGEGYHDRKGEPHAEGNALAAAGKLAEGGTAVVTLEPCNHSGRTPPCREALINANVARVLIAVMDPTSRGEGGAALLRQAGIDVEQDFLKDEALVVLGPWLSSVQARRPFITWIYEATPDGSPIVFGEYIAMRGEIAAIRESHDLVMTWNGKFEEGRPGSHGQGVFAMPESDIVYDSVEVLDTLLAAGARSVLIVGNSSEAASLLSVCPADQVISYMPNTPRSWAPNSDSGHIAALPDGYRITGARHEGNYVRLVGGRI